MKAVSKTSSITNSISRFGAFSQRLIKIKKSQFDRSKSKSPEKLRHRVNVEIEPKKFNILEDRQHSLRVKRVSACDLTIFQNKARKLNMFKSNRNVSLLGIRSRVDYLKAEGIPQSEKKSDYSTPISLNTMNINTPKDDVSTHRIA